MPNVNGAWARNWGHHRAFLHTIWWRRVSFASSRHLFDYIASQPWRSKAKLRIIRRLYMYAKRKWGMSDELWQSEPSYTPYGCGESTSIADPSPHEDTFTTIPTQPWQAQAKVRIIRRLHMYAKRKWGMSNELWRCEPSYTPYGCGESTSTLPTLPP